MGFSAQIKTLGIRPRSDGAPNTKAEIVRAYRKIVVTAHPDKGGDEVLFQRIQSSYDKAIKYAENYEADIKPYEYKVSIKKTAQVGIGIKVIENHDTGEVVVQGMHEKCAINEIGDEAQGTLTEGDVLIKIDEDDVSEYRFSRIKQRLNEFRVPTGSDVVLTFLRHPAHLEANELSSGSAGGTESLGKDNVHEANSNNINAQSFQRSYQEQSQIISDESVDMAHINASVALHREVRGLQTRLKETEQELASEKARTAALEAEMVKLRDQVAKANSNMLLAQKAESYANQQLQEVIVQGAAQDEGAAAQIMGKLLSSVEDIMGNKPCI